MKYKQTFAKLIFILAFFAADIPKSEAQSVSGKLSFTETRHNFGKIKEEDGPVSHTFEFTNTGSEPVVIQGVRASCGCTTPSWTKKPVLAGKKGFVKAIFNPANRPGTFSKSIRVNSNAENSPTVLYISGNVEKKPETIADQYRYEMDGLRLKRSNLHFGSIPNTKTMTKTIEVINDSDKDIKVGFNERRHHPAHITISCKPETLKPKEKGIISVTYNAAQKNDWGYVYDRIYVNVNGAFNSRNRLTVSASITEDFTEEQLANPPAMTFTNGEKFDFGTIEQGEKVEHTFKFKNTGKSDLIIRKTKASCGCTAIAPKDKVIKPGESSSIKAVFNSRGKRGRQHKTVTITTNIPNETKKVLRVVGHVNLPNTNSDK